MIGRFLSTVLEQYNEEPLLFKYKRPNAIHNSGLQSIYTFKQKIHLNLERKNSNRHTRLHPLV